MRFGRTIIEQAAALAAYSEDAHALTRCYLTAEHRAAGEYIASLMREAGMQAAFDALGNVVGRYAGSQADAPALLLGSHLDTVRNAGRYDGLFGILSAIACVGALHDAGRRLPCPIEIVAFGDEEGVRFGVTMTGSRALAGTFDTTWLDARDPGGVTLREALRTFGGDPDAIASLRRTPGSVAAYIESHIEQGPVLLDGGLPVGVVTAIAGATRVRVSVTGASGHAGTTPMRARRDALAAASAMVLAVETRCRGGRTLVGTVGTLTVANGAANVIPGSVAFTLDIRSGEDGERLTAVADLRSELERIAAGRGCEFAWDEYYAARAVPCDGELQHRLAQSIAAHAIPVTSLPSGAGHDAMAMAAIAPIGMLFVRCGNGGVSHDPSEALSAEDAELATSVLLHFLEHFHDRP